MIWDSISLKKALRVEVTTGIKACQVKFNSLDVDKDDIFIALPGNRDSHKFVEDALSRGASCAIVASDIKNVNSKKLIKVDNTICALNDLAEYKRKNSKAKFIAITGSVGKTSTREVIKTMLKPYGNTYSSVKSFNNHLGVPLTLASMPDAIEYAIVEIGMSSAGEISKLTNIVTPDIAVVTTISEGHMEFFDSVEAIADAKCEIFEGLDSNTGVAIINKDILTYDACIQNINKVGIKNLCTFSKKQNATVRFLSYELLEDNSVRLNFDIDSEECEIVMPNISMHLASNFSAGFSVVKALGLDIEKAVNAIRSFQPLMGRGRFVETKHNNKNLGIICDYYNSNPQSLKASLKYLQQFVSRKKTAVLGDMHELGEMQLDIHRSMVPLIIESGVSRLFLVGDIMREIKDSFPDNIAIQTYKNVDKMIEDESIGFEDEEIILIKGSRGMKLENFVKILGVKNVL